MFSLSVSEVQRAPPWKDSPKVFSISRRSAGSALVNERPLNRTSPCTGVASPTMLRRSVVLPTPVPPTMKKISAGARLKETPSRTLPVLVGAGEPGDLDAGVSPRS